MDTDAPGKGIGRHIIQAMRSFPFNSSVLGIPIMVIVLILGRDITVMHGNAGGGNNDMPLGGTGVRKGIQHPEKAL